MGRPSDYTDEIAAEICERIASGSSVRTICAFEGMPAPATLYRWLTEREAFQEQYAHARERQADFYAEEIIQIADDGTNDTYATDKGEETNHDVIARSRLRVDARKWYASKLAPKKYGDKIAQELSGPNGGPIQQETTLRPSLTKEEWLIEHGIKK